LVFVPVFAGQAAIYVCDAGVAKPALAMFTQAYSGFSGMVVAVQLLAFF
jgi:hypothetical protein